MDLKWFFEWILKMAEIPKWIMQYFCYPSSINTESPFSHIFMASFDIYCGGVQRQHYKISSLLKYFWRELCYFCLHTSMIYSIKFLWVYALE